MCCNTLEYYNTNAQLFSNDTLELDFTEVQDSFLMLLPENALILDFGCGAGRDTKYFLEKGYRVEAVDGSEEICKVASRNTGITVKHMLFQELDEDEKYDGVWSCASLLHLQSSEIVPVLNRVNRSLKEGGILYLSFKYGDYEGERNGRYFTDMTEDKMNRILKESGCFSVTDEWITADVRPGREDEKWLNMFLKKDKQNTNDR